MNSAGNRILAIGARIATLFYGRLNKATGLRRTSDCYHQSVGPFKWLFGISSVQNGGAHRLCRSRNTIDFLSGRERERKGGTYYRTTVGWRRVTIGVVWVESNVAL